VNDEPTEITGQIARLILDAGFDNSTIPELSLADLAGGKWEGLDFANHPGKPVLVDDQIRVAIPVQEGTRKTWHSMMRVRNKPTEIQLTDGTNIAAELTRLPCIDTHANVVLHHWTWIGETTPSVWVGDLTGYLPTSGNLSLEQRGATGYPHEIKHDGFRLEGHYTWYLIRRENGTHRVVLDCHGETPTREALVKEIVAMQFAFGASLGLDRLFGLDAAGRSVGAMSVGHYLRYTDKHRSPVPDFLWDAEVWPPEFFRLVATALHNDGLQPLLIPIGAYLDAEAGHLDGGYLTVHTALEAFANSLLKAELLVRDEENWKRWVDTLVPEIKRHLPNANDAEKFRNKFVAAMYESSGRRIERALRTHGVILPPEVRTEIGKRNISAHGFMMNSDRGHDVDRDSRRLEMIQTLIAALVACHVGYKGPLKGYDVADDGGRVAPLWWPIALRDEDVKTWFICRRVMKHRDVTHDDVAQAAYFRWQSRGREHGKDWDDWFAAEQALLRPDHSRRKT
jgi:hypothetical protein